MTGPGLTLTDVPGVTVGHWTDPEGLTGVTVMVFPEPNVAAAEVRGAAPGTREFALLAPGMTVQTIQALVFAGGSAFGLAAADGVVRALEDDGRGYPTPFGPVPIVPAAILFDLQLGDPQARPGAAEGRAAYAAATGDPVAMGNVGAGAGASVSAWRGPGARHKGGLGSAGLRVGEATVAALAVVNAAGDVFTLEGSPLTGGPAEPPLEPTLTPADHGQTTLVAVVTDIELSRSELQRVAVRSQDALAACLRPGHTRYDGDAAFAVSTGTREASADAAGEAAFVVTARAIEAGMRAARPAGGLPAMESSEES